MVWISRYGQRSPRTVSHFTKDPNHHVWQCFSIRTCVLTSKLGFLVLIFPCPGRSGQCPEYRSSWVGSDGWGRGGGDAGKAGSPSSSKATTRLKWGLVGPGPGKWCTCDSELSLYLHWRVFYFLCQELPNCSGWYNCLLLNTCSVRQHSSNCCVYISLISPKKKNQPLGPTVLSALRKRAWRFRAVK